MILDKIIQFEYEKKLESVLVTDKEGGYFWKVVTGTQNVSEQFRIVRKLYDKPIIILFRTGQQYDDFLSMMTMGFSHWRHRYSGGRKNGKITFNNQYENVIRESVYLWRYG